MASAASSAPERPKASPSSALATLAKIAALAKVSPEPDVQHMVRQIEEHVAKGGIVPLDKSLELRSRGGVSPKRASQLDDRDAQLRNLVSEHAEWACLDPHIAARQMREAFERYEANRWPRERDAITSPISEPAATFWRLLRDGQHMPGAKQLTRILHRDIQSPV